MVRQGIGASAPGGWAIAIGSVALCGCSVIFAPDGRPGGPADAGDGDAAVGDAMGCFDGTRDVSAWDDVTLVADSSAVATDAAALRLDQPGDYHLDTTNLTLFEPGGDPMTVSLVVQSDPTSAAILSAGCFVVAANSRLRAIGTRPLVIAVWGNAIIDGGIDVSSGDDQPEPIGAGAGAGSCSAGIPPVAEPVVGGGGAGGSLGGQGGDGGSAGIAAGGMSGPSIPATRLRGGCPGQVGGNQSGNSAAVGGGGVGIAALTVIDVSGTIDAGGAGGSGASDKAAPENRGGNGGGSGGMIELEAPAVRVNQGAVLAANGGAGGGGEGDAVLSDVAEDGENGLAGEIAASGGLAEESGGDGGEGSGKAELNGAPGVNANPGALSAGGGGGGGGAGIIGIRSADGNVHPGAVVSPPHGDLD